MKARLSSQEATALIRAELTFLLERSEQSFARQLLAHLLEEGCNLPLVLAKPRFYELLLAELFAHTSPLLQAQFVREFPSLQGIASQTQDQGDEISHADFFRMTVFFKSHLDSTGKQIALAVTTSIETLKKEWQLAETFCQEDMDTFEIRLQPLLKSLCQGVQTSVCPIPLELVRRRLYLALTTSLLRHIGERKSFQAAFGSIPEIVKAMQQDHQVFCRFMAFCQERIPYFIPIASQTFWRTLETLRLEVVNITPKSDLTGF